MSLHGRLGGMLLSLALAGGGAAYIASAGGEAVAQVSGAEDTYYYILREYEGKIALFKDGCDTPEAVYSTPPDMLNAADLALLQEGIRLNGIADVLRLLEDLELE